MPDARKILRAANPDYEDITMGPEDRVVGAVVAVLKKDPPGLQIYERLVSGITGRGHDWASLAVTAANIGWSPRDIEEMVKLMAKVPRQVKE